MIEIEVKVADAAQTRIASDAVWETTAAIESTVHPREHLIHHRLRPLVPSNPRFDLDFLDEILADHHWTPDTLGPTPSSTPRDPMRQFEALLETDPETVETDLATVSRLHPGSRAARMSPDEFLERLSDVLSGYWQAVLAPMWDRVEAIVEADIEHRRRILARDGLSTAIEGMHHRLGVVDDRIQIEMGCVQITTRAAGNGIWFVPSVFGWPWIKVDFRPAAPVVCYGARGAARLWETTTAADRSDALGGLIGRTRAALLAELSVPRSTSELALALGLSPGTVSEHLSLMSDSGLLQSHRSGRRVLYERTPMGSLLLHGGAMPADMAVVGLES